MTTKKKAAKKPHLLGTDIEKEINKLKSMKPKVRHYSMFGDDNHAAIDAQIEVLEKSTRIDEQTIYDTYQDPDDETDNTHVLDSALDALRWLNGEEEAPSKAWEGLMP